MFFDLTMQKLILTLSTFAFWTKIALLFIEENAKMGISRISMIISKYALKLFQSIKQPSLFVKNKVEVTATLNLSLRSMSSIFEVVGLWFDINLSFSISVTKKIVQTNHFKRKIVFQKVDSEKASVHLSVDNWIINFIDLSVPRRKSKSCSGKQILD